MVFAVSLLTSTRIWDRLQSGPGIRDIGLLTLLIPYDDGWAYALVSMMTGVAILDLRTWREFNLHVNCVQNRVAQVRSKDLRSKQSICHHWRDSTWVKIYGHSYVQHAPFAKTLINPAYNRLLGAARYWTDAIWRSEYAYKRNVALTAINIVTARALCIRNDISPLIRHKRLHTPW